MPSIFTRIILGEIPCHKVYQDSHVLAMLDINPIAPGHTLVIPTEPAETLDKLSDDSAAAIGRLLPRLCRAVCKATGCNAYNLLQNNGSGAHQAVMHVHFHIIPKPDPSRGLGIGWPASKLDNAAGTDLAKSIARALAG
jgi:histidine triad (HIT) family protein